MFGYVPGSLTAQDSRPACEYAVKDVAFRSVSMRRRPGVWVFRGSSSWPIVPPVYASTPPSRATPQDSEPVWFATPSPYDSFIRYILPASMLSGFTSFPPVRAWLYNTRCLRHRLLTHVAVGIRIAPYPPHGSQRAGFPHWALAVGRDARTARSWTPRFGLWVKSGVRLADLAVVPPCFLHRASQHGALERLDSISFRSFAVRRIQASALGALFRLRVRNAFCWPRFPLAVG
jgi:hypothetical protein